MSSLKMPEKDLLETLFNFENDGYVLDFKNHNFADFFRDYGIDIYSEKYNLNGTSKMKRLKAFWGIESDKLVGEILEALLQYALFKNLIHPESESYIGQARKIIARLQGKNISQEEIFTSEQHFLHREFPEIDWVKLNIDAPFQKVLKQRTEEINKTLETGAPLSVIFLCGSTLEGLLQDLASRNPKIFNQTKAASKDKNGKVKSFQEWTLANLIDASYEVKLISRDARDHGHLLRNFRNYIHPREQILQEFNPDMYTAKMSWQVLQMAIADLSGLRE